MAEPEVQSNNPAEGTSFAAEIQEIAGLDDEQREVRIAAKLEEALQQKKEGKTEALAERVRLMLDLAKGSLTPEQLAKFRESLGKVQDRKAEEIGKDGNFLNTIDTKAQQYLPLEMSTNAKRATAGVAGIAAVIAAIKWGPKLVVGAVKGAFEWTIMKPLRWFGRGLKRAGKWLLIGAAAMGVGLGIAKFFGVDLSKVVSDIRAGLRMGESIAEAEQKAKEALAKAKEEAARLKAEAEKLHGEARVKADAIAQAAEQKVTELAQKATELGEKAKEEVKDSAETELETQQSQLISMEYLKRHRGVAEEMGVDVRNEGKSRAILAEMLRSDSPVQDLTIDELRGIASGRTNTKELLKKLLGREPTPEQETMLRFLARTTVDRVNEQKDASVTEDTTLSEIIQRDSMLLTVMARVRKVVTEKGALSNPFEIAEAAFGDAKDELGAIAMNGNILRSLGVISGDGKNEDDRKNAKAFTEYCALQRGISLDAAISGAEGVNADALNELRDYLRDPKVLAYLELYTHGKKGPWDALRTHVAGDGKPDAASNITLKDALELYTALQLAIGPGEIPTLKDSDPVGATLTQLKVMQLLYANDREKAMELEALLGSKALAASSVDLPPGTVEFMGKLFAAGASESANTWSKFFKDQQSRLYFWSAQFAEDHPEWFYGGIAGGVTYLVSGVRRWVKNAPLRQLARTEGSALSMSETTLRQRYGILDHNAARQIGRDFMQQRGRVRRLTPGVSGFNANTYNHALARRAVLDLSPLSASDIETKLSVTSEVAAEIKQVADSAARYTESGIVGRYTGSNRRGLLQAHQRIQRLLRTGRPSIAPKVAVAATVASSVAPGPTLNPIQTNAPDTTQQTSTVDTQAEQRLRTEFDQRMAALEQSQREAQTKPAPAPSVDTEAEQKLRTELETGLASVRLAQEQTARLQRELQEKTAELDRKIEANGNADNTQIQELRRELDLARAELVVARDQANENVRATEEARAKLESELGARIKTLEADLQKQKTNTEGATDSVNSVQESFEAMQDEIDSLKQEISDLRTASKRELDKATNALTDKVAALESSQQKATRAQETLAQKTKALEQAQEKSAGDTKKLAEEVAQARTDVAKVQEDVIAKAKATEAAQLEVKTRLQAQVDVLGKEADSARAEAEAQAEAIVELGGQLEAAKLEQETQRTTATENTDARVKAEKELQTRIDNLNEQLTQARTATSAQGETVTKLQQDLNKANQDLAAQKKAAGEAALELDRRLSKMKGDLDLSIGVLQRESDAAKTKQSELTEALKLERETNGQNVTRIDSELKAITERAAALEQELKLAKQQQSELVTQVEQVKKSQQDAQSAQQRGPRDPAPVKNDPRSDGRGPDKGNPDAGTETDPKGPRQPGNGSVLEVDLNPASRARRPSAAPSQRPDLSSLQAEARRYNIDVRGKSDAQVRADVESAKAKAGRR